MFDIIIRISLGGILILMACGVCVAVRLLREEKKRNKYKKGKMVIDLLDDHYPKRKNV